MNSVERRLNLQIKENPNINTNNISDGYHTFGELYKHRIQLYLSLISYARFDTRVNVWYAHKHSDGEIWDGWILVGIENKETGEQVSYHIESSYEKRLKELDIQMYDLGLQWDGHSSDDVLGRLAKWF